MVSSLVYALVWFGTFVLLDQNHRNRIDSRTATFRTGTKANPNQKPTQTNRPNDVHLHCDTLHYGSCIKLLEFGVFRGWTLRITVSPRFAERCITTAQMQDALRTVKTPSSLENQY